MARTDLHFKLRIPPDLLEELKEIAENNGRSVTSEIVFRLRDSIHRSKLGGLSQEDYRLLSKLSEEEKTKFFALFFAAKNKLNEAKLLEREKPAPDAKEPDK